MWVRVPPPLPNLFMDFEATYEKAEVTTAEEYKKMIDQWAVAFIKRHLPDFVFSDPVNLMPAFQALHNIGIDTHCIQEELIVGVPKIVTYSFTSGDIVLAELKIKLAFE